MTEVSKMEGVGEESMNQIVEYVDAIRTQIWKDPAQAPVGMPIAINFGTRMDPNVAQRALKPPAWLAGGPRLATYRGAALPTAIKPQSNRN